MIDKQAIFNAVVAHSRAQPRKAMEGAMCKYRTDDGRRCFVGALVPDELYDRCMEGGTINALHVYEHELDSMSTANRKLFQVITEMYGKLDATEWELLKVLQRTHDENEVEHWEREHRLVATEFGLVYTPSLE